MDQGRVLCLNNTNQNMVGNWCLCLHQRNFFLFKGTLSKESPPPTSCSYNGFMLSNKVEQNMFDLLSHFVKWKLETWSASQPVHNKHIYIFQDSYFIFLYICMCKEKIKSPFLLILSKGKQHSMFLFSLPPAGLLSLLCPLWVLSVTRDAPSSGGWCQAGLASHREGQVISCPERRLVPHSCQCSQKPTSHICTPRPLCLSFLLQTWWMTLRELPHASKLDCSPPSPKTWTSSPTQESITGRG